MAKITFYTLGCKANQYETSVMERKAAEAGFEISKDSGMADICVINTCTVTKNAGRKSRSAIRLARKRNPEAWIIVTGCMADIDQNELEEMGIADEIVKNHDKPEIMNRLMNGSHTSHLAPRASPFACRIRENLLIENGCDEMCAYCIVPYARGSVVSRPEDEILAEAKRLVDLGARELVLTGINLGAFGKDLGISPLPRLLGRLSEIEGLLRIRLSSIEPQYITDELLEAVRESDKVMHHLHIPLQSGDDMVLRQMKRKYTSGEYLSLVKKIKGALPDVSLNTDIIVGFPGESEEAFANTLGVVKQAGFSRIHPFHFSERPGTAAAEITPRVPSHVIKERMARAHTLKHELLEKSIGSQIGEIKEVLAESFNKRTGIVEGLTEGYIRVRFKGDGQLPGRIAEVTILKADGECAKGRLSGCS